MLRRGGNAVDAALAEVVERRPGEVLADDRDDGGFRAEARGESGVAGRASNLADDPAGRGLDVVERERAHDEERHGARV